MSTEHNLTQNVLCVYYVHNILLFCNIRLHVQYAKKWHKVQSDYMYKHVLFWKEMMVHIYIYLIFFNNC